MATEDTECSVCLNTYNPSDHRPKILPCSHTFCKSCIHELCNQVQPKCPICEKDIEKHDIIAITTNFGTLELIENNAPLNEECTTNLTEENSSLLVNNHGRDESEQTTSISSSDFSSEDAQESTSSQISVKEQLCEDLVMKFQEDASSSTQVKIV